MDVTEVWIYDDEGHGPDGGEPLKLKPAEDGKPLKDGESITLTWNDGIVSFEL